MTESDTRSQAAPWRRFVPLVLGLVILFVLLLTPLKRWLNQIPHLWEVLYPLLTLFSGYLVVDAIRHREAFSITAIWGVLFLAALSATLFIYTGDRLFFTLSRWGAFIFIIAQIVDTILDVGRDADAG